MGIKTADMKYIIHIFTFLAFKKNQVRCLLFGKMKSNYFRSIFRVFDYILLLQILEQKEGIRLWPCKVKDK
ncbi:MAG: hypothetical protein M3Z01_09715, partial [Thermoproteota archaeon]|nr:hypothetical protein [Thermoproteota archaeon]